jgi:hypothetical protein
MVLTLDLVYLKFVFVGLIEQQKVCRIMVDVLESKIADVAKKKKKPL